MIKFMKTKNYLLYLLVGAVMIPVSITYAVAVDGNSGQGNMVQRSVSEGTQVVEEDTSTAPTALPISPLKRATEVKMKAEERQAQVQEKVDQMQERKEEIQTKVEETKAKIHEKAMLRCQNVESKINFEITRYENHKNHTTTMYDRISARLDTIVERLQAKDIDTTALESEIVAFKAKSKIVKADYESYIALLEETKQYTCGQSEGEFKNKLNEARTQLQKTRGSLVNARSFYQTNVVPAMQALRQQVQTMQSNQNSTLNPIAPEQGQVSNTLN
jgi:hypothetical protein